MTQMAYTGVATRIGSKALIREMNEALVLDVVRRRGTTSRAEIVGMTGLSAATVTGITAQLVGSGLLSETDVLRGTGGRPARLLELGRDAVVSAGVRLSQSHADVALVDLRGDVIGVGREPLASTAPEDAAAAIARGVDDVLGRRPRLALRGISVAVSGIVDKRSGLVRHSGALGWEHVPLADLIAEQTGGRVVIDSLVNSFTKGLLLLDPALAERDVIVCSVGASLGASIVVEGRIHRGYNGSAGGFAHSRATADQGGRACHCGDFGCLETWSSEWGMTQERERRAGAGIDLDGEDAAEVLAEGGHRLGLAIANAGKMFGPERVVLALSPNVSGTAFEDGCREAYAREYQYSEDRAPELIVIAAESEVFARGAGYELIAELFSSR